MLVHITFLWSTTGRTSDFGMKQTFTVHDARTATTAAEALADYVDTSANDSEKYQGVLAFVQPLDKDNKPTLGANGQLLRVVVTPPVPVKPVVSAEQVRI